MTNRPVSPRASAARTRNAGPGDARALQRRRIALAVQLAFAVGAGAALIAPVHAQQIACSTGSLIIAAAATNTIPCDVDGTLNINSGGALTNSGALTVVSPGGMLNNNAGGTLTNSNYLRNYGTLNNNAGGTLTNDSYLSNYSGATLSNSGALTNSGYLYNRPGATLSNSGTLTNNNYLRNYGTLNNSAGGTLTNNYLLYNYSGATLSNSGTLANNNYLRNDGTLTNSGNFYNATGATLSNAGTLTVTATGNLYGGGSLTQSAGTLRVDGTLSQYGLTINGGTLTGTGTITAPVINSGTLLAGAPGVPGTLSIVGSLTQNPAAVLVVNVTPAQASRVTITGPASIAGTVQVVAGAGTYPATPYTILSATGGVTGTFSSVTSNSAFLSPALAYDPNTVFLTLTQIAAFSSVALTPNQLAVSTLLGNIQTGGGGSADMQTVLAALSGLPAGEARAAFDSLAAAGRTGAGFNAQFGMTGGFIRTITNRLGGGRGADSGPFALGGVQLAAGNGVLSDANPVYAQAAGRPAGADGAARDGGWVLAYGNDGKTTGDANATGYRQNGAGVALGADATLNAQWRVGAALNIGKQRVRGDAGTGNLDTDGVALAAYARYADGPVTVNAIAGVGRNSNEGARAVSVGGLARVASSDYHSNQQFAHLEASYTIPMKGYRLEPVAALGYTRVANAAYTETGAGALNLVLGGQARESTRSYLGVRSVHALENGGKGLQLTARALWSHEFGNADSAVTSAQLAGAPGAFQTSGVNLRRDGAVLGLGLSGELRPNLALFGDIGVETRNKQSNATVQVGARYTW